MGFVLLFQLNNSYIEGRCADRDSIRVGRCCLSGELIVHLSVPVSVNFIVLLVNLSGRLLPISRARATAALRTFYGRRPLRKANV